MDMRMLARIDRNIWLVVNPTCWSALYMLLSGAGIVSTWRGEDHLDRSQATCEKVARTK